MENYTITRSKRKTLGIYIKDGNVEVRAPLRCPKSEIVRFVGSHESWINDKLNKSKILAEKKKAFTLKYGDEILFRGKTYPIIARENIRADFDGECFYLPSNLDSALIKDICIKIYRRIAKEYFTERVAVYAEKMGVMPASVKINCAKTRWGSCSIKKNINFSWRLIMADDDVIDYVIVHELVHLIHMNHSKEFWAVVKNVLPDYEKCKSKLRKLQKKLNAEDWN